jgi:outer membrane lipoprotein-sorting protein
MKRFTLITVLGPLCLLAASSAAAQQLTPQQILERSDDVFNAPSDQYWEMKVVVTDNAGRQKVREAMMYQKGYDKRLTKFTAPADQKGIGFLSLPNDVMYLYLPAFSKTRRIASHVKNTKFAGTDFTYEDMEAKRDADKWNGTLKGTDDAHYIIEMSLKPGKTSEYSKIVKWILKENYFPDKMEMYDKAGNLYKRLVREQVEKVGGFWTCHQYEMKDVKEDHTTRMVLMNIKFNSGVSDDIFTERFLAR